MGLFSKSKLTSDEYADLLNKIVKLNSDVLLLSANVERMEIRLKTFHTKLTKSKYEDEDETDAPVDMAEVQRRLMGFGNAKE